MPCQKVPYASRYEARAVLLALWKRGGRKEAASYFCQECQVWHLTKRRRRAP